MKTFSSMRRDILRTGSIGMAAAAIPAVSFAAAAREREKATAETKASQGLFDVR